MEKETHELKLTVQTLEQENTFLREENNKLKIVLETYKANKEKEGE